MKTKQLLIIVIVLVVIVAALIAFLYFRSVSSQTTNVNSTSTSTSSSPFNSATNNAQTNKGSSGATITLATQSGNTTKVSDFTKTSTYNNTDDPNTPYYTVVGDPNQEDPSQEAFQIEFYPKVSQFIITILQEPIGNNRLAAEAVLRAKLGNPSNDLLCSLKMYVGVPVGVNQNYPGENLGLSFCPGAVQLPQ